MAPRLCTFRDCAQARSRSLGQKATATREDYRRALDRVRLDELGERPIRAIRYSELMSLIGTLQVAGKTLNNYLIPLRGVFELTRREGAIVTNPASADAAARAVPRSRWRPRIRRCQRWSARACRPRCSNDDLISRRPSGQWSPRFAAPRLRSWRCCPISRLRWLVDG